MKGLLLKDLYMSVKYFKSTVLMIIVFIGLSCLGTTNTFFTFYPALLSSMIPVNLLAYDERAKWDVYCGTLPYSKAQIVSAKYIVGLIVQLLVLVLTGIAHGVRLYTDSTFTLEGYWTIMGTLCSLSLVSGSISLPFIFRLGVAKGRMAYLVTIGVVAGVSGALSFGVSSALPGSSDLSGIVPLLTCLAAAGIYAFSWYLSIVLYRKREVA